ncbi:MAG: carboxypeptidase-like regulatory domain-containing protein, partial [Aureispira sp.]|nr:carboxypeptidase-like regulatory domain-containing protein [Aureispira sp.]
MKNTILTFSIFLLFSTLNFAQSITITGVVIDNDTEEAMPFCNVYVYGTSNGVTTDIDGNYSIKFDLSEGDTLATNSLGYADVLKPVDKTKDEQVINFRMTSGSLEMGINVTVLAGENPANE